MKVKSLITAHDVVVGKVYDVVYKDFSGKGVWVTDDVGDNYIMWDFEYEVVA